jgi:hypothetical protein
VNKKPERLPIERLVNKPEWLVNNKPLANKRLVNETPD